MHFAVAYGGNDNTFDGGNGNDRLTLGGGNDTGLGGNGNDKIFGGLGDDVLKGGTGNDSCEGGADRDVLMGQGGRDSLFGGGGADQLIGGDGNDELTGGNGPDTFVYLDRKEGHDRILDFKDGTDLIDLSAIGRGFGSLQITDTGNDTLIEFGKSSITLVQFDAALISASDFIFA